MKWRVMVELGGAEGTVKLHEVSVGGGTTTEYSAETLGLTIAEGNTAWFKKCCFQVTPKIARAALAKGFRVSSVTLI